MLKYRRKLSMKELKIKLTFLEECLGTANADKDIHREFIASKAPDAKSREEEIEAIGVEEAIEKAMTVFPRDTDGDPIFYDYQIKGFFKDACSALQRCKGEEVAKYSSKLKAYKKVIDGCIFPQPRMIKIDMHGAEIGNCQRPLRAQTAQGDRVALANSETIPAGSTIEFSVLCLSDDYVNPVLEWLNYGRFKGLGQWRNSGKGAFTYELVE